MTTPAAALSLVESHAGWWALAGLEVGISESPIDWLAISAPASAPAIPSRSVPEIAPRPAEIKVRAPVPLAPAPAPAAPLAPLAIPDEWSAFQSWLANDPAVPGTRWNTRRVLPQGAPGARLMLLSLCPEMDDDHGGALHSGAAGLLLDAMLRAIGLTRSDCYIASLALTRPPGGRIDDSELAELSGLLWHHLRLAQPQRLLIFGTDLARLIAATDVTAARGKLLYINQDGVKVEAVATQHPLLLRDRAARKAAAWDSLKHLAQG